jgi:hypothetical protein
MEGAVIETCFCAYLKCVALVVCLTTYLGSSATRAVCASWHARHVHIMQTTCFCMQVAEYQMWQILI